MTTVLDEVPAPLRKLPRRGHRHRSWVLALTTRLGWMALVVWTAVSLTFVMSRLVPADPARLAAGLQAGPEQVAQVRAELGLDLPVWQQYLQYLWGIVRLDLGDSIQTRQPVLGDIVRYLPTTLELVLVAFVVYALVGVGLGVVWAAAPRGLHTKLIAAAAVVGAALPVFWVGLVLQLTLASRLDWFPISGSMSYSETGVPRRTGATTLDALLALDPGAFAVAVHHMVLPVTAIVVGQLGVAIRLTRSSTAQQLRQAYVRTARARGVPFGRVVVVDVLRNALAPVVTMLGLQFGWMLGGTILVEVVFSWPGLGTYANNAFRTFDYNPILAITLVVTVVFVVVNELIEVLYRVLDPRLKDPA